MKLHLPKALFTAVMALFAVSQTTWGEVYLLTDDSTGNLTYTKTSDGQRLLYDYADDDGKITFNGNIDLGTLSYVWVGPGSQANNNGYATSSQSTLITLGGIISGSAELKLNEYTGNDTTAGNAVYILSNTANTYTGLISLSHGGNEKAKVQLSITSNSLSNSAVSFDSEKGSTILSIETNASLKGLSGGTADSLVTSDSVDNTLTLNGTDTYNYAGKIGRGDYFNSDASTFTTSTTADQKSTALNIAKTGSGTQTFSGEVNLGTVSVSAGTLNLSGTTTLNTATVTAGTLNLSGTTTLSEATVTAGTLNLSGTSNGGSYNASVDGKLNIDALTVTTDAALTLTNAALTGTITNNASGEGKGVTLAGAITFSDSYVEHSANTNGYITTATTKLSMLQGNGTYTMANGVTFNGIAGTEFVQTDGIYTYTEENTDTFYHIVSGTVNYSSVTQSVGHQGFDVYGGATLNINDSNSNQIIKLRENATLANTTADRCDTTGYNEQQIKQIILSGDAKINAQKKFGITAGSYAQAVLNLDGHKLTKEGAELFSVTNAQVSAGEIDITAGEFRFNAKSNTKGGVLSIADALIVNVAQNAQLTWWSDLDGTVTKSLIDSSTEAKFHTLNFLRNATGTGTINLLNKNVFIETGSESTFAGTIKVGKDLALGSAQEQASKFGSATIELSENSRLRHEGKGSTIGTLKVVGNATLNHWDADGSAADSLTISTLNIDDDKKLTVNNRYEGIIKVNTLTGAGDFYVDTNGQTSVKVLALQDYTGAITNNNAAGVLNLGSENGSIALTGAITNNGTLTFATGLTINIADHNSFDGVTYSDGLVNGDGSASSTGNGFIGGTATVQVVKGTGSSNIADVTVKYNNEVQTLTDGAFTVAGIITPDYVLNGTGEYANGSMSNIVAQATTAGITVQRVTLGNGNMLTIDAAPATQFNIEAGEGGTSTLDIAQKQTVSSANVAINSGSMQFTGSGTYTMLGGLKGTAAANWTGTVRLHANGDDNNPSNALQDVTDLDLTQYGNENSTIVLKGVKGYFAKNVGEIKSDITFENGGKNDKTWAALDLVNGYGGSSYTFSGTLSGDGNVIVNKDLTIQNQPTLGMGFTFSGNVSEFTGQLKNNAGYNTYTFQGDATAVNALIQAVGGTMNIHTDNTKDTTIKTISVSSKLNLENQGSGKMTVNSLDTQSNAAVYVTASSGDIEITGNAPNGVKNGTTLAGVSVADGKKVTVTDNVTVTTGLTFAGAEALAVTGTLTLNDSISLDLTQFQVKQGVATYTLAYASEGITANVDTFNISGLTDYAYNVVLSATDPASAVAPANDAATMNYLVLQLELPATPLTELTVTGGSYADGHLTLQTEQDATGAIFGDKLNAVMSDKVWDAIRADVDGEMKELITVSFVGADGTTLFDFNGEDGATNFTIPTITINGEGTQGTQVLTGDGTVVGNYVTAYIPEPTTGTLSILALAALAVRRRRR